MDITTCLESPHKAVELFYSLCEDFKPIKKFTSFFDNENFLLTTYKPSNASIHTIVENYRGEIIEFSSLNCGYIGAGPNATARVLQSIGLNEDLSLFLREHTAMQIDFEMFDRFGASSIVTTSFFNGKVNAKDFSGCNLDKHTVADLSSRTVYMINPEIHNFTGLLNCLQVMKPIEFEYVIGKNFHMIKYEEVFSVFKGLPDNTPIDTKGVNLIIRGEQFDLKCFISEKLFRGTINSIYTYLMKKSLFEECSVGTAYTYSKNQHSSLYAWWETLLLLFHRPKSALHQILDVNDKGLKRNEI